MASHRFDVSQQGMEAAGLKILATSREAGVHMAVSDDEFKYVFFQGHPEYDKNSLLKEYKREVVRYLSGELQTPPPMPEFYFSAEAEDIAQRFLKQAQEAHASGLPMPGMLEDELDGLLDNTWGDTAKALVNNWLGLVYKLTNLDRNKLFMDGVDPDDPLRLKT